MARTTYLVDDDDGVRRAFRSLLGLQPHQIVRDFASGEAFLAEAESLEPGVLLLDLNMPGLSGLEVFEELQSRHRGKFTVLILTGMGSVSNTLEAMRNGVFDFIEKPCDAQSLFDTVDAAHAMLALDGAAAALAAQARASVDSLSGHEYEVLIGLLGGKANKEIAETLDISSRTVEIYRSNMMAKLKVRTLSAAMRVALVAGVAPPCEPGARAWEGIADPGIARARYSAAGGLGARHD